MPADQSDSPCCPPSPGLLSEDRAGELSLALKALCDPVRLRIFHHIAANQGASVCACHMPEVFGVSQPTLSHHLKKLMDAGLVEKEMRGRWAHFTPTSDRLADLIHFLSTMSDWIPEQHASRPRVLFVCVKNSGKSQMAAALLRKHIGDQAVITSAGTIPGSALNQASVQAVADLGATLTGEFPKPIDPEILRTADRVIVIGKEAELKPIDGMKANIETWLPYEPSQDGIEGTQRMQIICEELNQMTAGMAAELASSHGLKIENDRKV